MPKKKMFTSFRMRMAGLPSVKGVPAHQACTVRRQRLYGRGARWPNKIE